MADVQIAIIDEQATEITLAVPGVQGPAGPGVPASGTQNQLLVKQSGVDYDTAWSDNIDVPGTLDVTGDATFDQDVTVQGDLTVNGTTVTIDAQTLVVEDKNIELGNVTTPTDVTADGGGITLKGTTDKTINWVDATDSWTSSENVDLASGKSYRINGTEVLSATALGSAVQISSANIPNGTIVDADINATAEIAVSKLADGSARQLLQTDAAGTGVEWTNNVDIPGTLDVTGATTLDSTLSVPLGSAASPSIFFTGDTNTGIYSPGADQVAISTNGTGRLFVDASGRVGVGNSSMSSFTGNAGDNLVVGAGSASEGITIYSGTSGQGSISFADGVTGNEAYRGYIAYSHTLDAFQFITAATEKLRITSTGTVNIVGAGTAGSTQAVSFNGSAPINSVVLDSSGRLGLGNSSPGAKLHVGAITPLTGNLSPTAAIVSDANASGDAETTLGIYQGGFLIGSAVGLVAGVTGGTAPYFALKTRPAAGGDSVERLRVDSSGRVGVGTTSPGESLSLTEGTALGWNDASGNNAARIYATSGDELRFDRGSTNSRSMTIDSSGRLLVGTSSQSGGALLQVNGDRIRVATAKTPASATDTGTAGEICWDANYVYVCTATNTWKRSALSTW